MIFANPKPKHIDFSILVPSRERIELLGNLCSSIARNTINPDKIEVLIAYDLDDEATIKVINDFSNTYGSWLKFIGRQRGTSISRDYYNWLYKASAGKYIIGLNDDCRIETLGWDYIIKNKIDKCGFGDNIFYGWIGDAYPVFVDPFHTRLSGGSFPLVSRQAIQKLGYFMHEDLGGWGADIYLYNLYSQANRIICFHEVTIYHISAIHGKRPRDATSFSMGDKTGTINMPSIEKDVMKIKREG